MNSRHSTAHILWLAIILSVFAASGALGQFGDIKAELGASAYGSMAWGDYNNDGNLDLAVCGKWGTSPRVAYATTVYVNKGDGIFAPVASLAAVSNGAVAWGDYDNDGDLDLVVVGASSSGTPTAKLYNNADGSFTDTGAAITGVVNASAAWGDFDNNGYLDLVITGAIDKDGVLVPYTAVYRNTGGVLGAVATDLPNVSNGSVACADFDRDGNLDVALTGTSTPEKESSPLTVVFRGNGDCDFREFASEMIPVWNSSLAWGDYNNDGWPDLVVAGTDAYGNSLTALYQNGRDVFNRVKVKISGASYSSVAWGDFNNDGLLDLAVSGDSDGARHQTRVYQNLGNDYFEPVSDSFYDVFASSVAWGDYDNDGRLDLALAGATGDATDPGGVCAIYRNEFVAANTPPVAPTGLSAFFTGNTLALVWNQTADDVTPAEALTYNLRIGTVSGTDNKMCAMADTMTGRRRIPASGNMQTNNSRAIDWQPSSTYHCSVQAIDGAYAGSAWSTDLVISFRTISGYVKNSANAGMAGVRLQCSNNGPNATTDSSGYYSMTVLTGWSGTVSAAKTGYLFSPAARSYTNVTSNMTNQDYSAPAFQQAPGVIPSLVYGALAWGDYDNDNDLDLVMAGQTPTGKTMKIYKNNGGGNFADSGIALPAVSGAGLAWGDYDGDGYLDLAYAGNADAGYAAGIYHNNRNGTFTELNAGLRPVGYSSVAWGDYNNDGRLDLVVSGWGSGGQYTDLYRNDGNGVFTNANAGLVGVADGAVRWADYDNDADLDLLVMGGGSGGLYCNLYRNDNGVFTLTSTFTGAWRGSAEFGDFDNDGDLDLVYVGDIGSSSTIPAIYMYLNNNGSFVNTYCPIHPTYNGSLALGDYDNDGLVDILVCGTSRIFGTLQDATRIYRNAGGGNFVEMTTTLPNVSVSRAAWADIDNDNDLDLALIGSKNLTNFGGIFASNLITVNNAPTAPTGLSFASVGNETTFKWNASTDVQTPAAALSYNLRVGTAPGKNDIVAGECYSYGWRRVPALGNAGMKLQKTVKGMAAGTYFWQVQAVDASYVGSAWSAEQTLVIPKISGYVRTPSGSPISGVTITGSNGAVGGVTNSQGYYEVVVPPAWGGTVAPYRGGWTFGPASLSFTNVTQNQVNQNFVAQQYKISGTVLSTQGQPVANVTVSLSTGGSSVTDALGHYELFVPNGWWGSVAAAKSGWTFSPQTRPLSGIGADVSGQDFTAAPPLFENTGTAIAPIYNGKLAWGDYDGDGDLDLAMRGTGEGYGSVTKIYKNAGDGTFGELPMAFPTSGGDAIAWGDYDGDGDLDLAVGNASYDNSIGIKIYRNDGGDAFNDTGIKLDSLDYGVLTWVDYDNDGDLDLAACGYITYSGRGVAFYRNDRNGVFTKQIPAIRGVDSGGFAFGDFDNDGDQDVAISGYYSMGIYKNDGSGNYSYLTDLGYSYESSLAWGDFDNDGDLDLAVAGFAASDNNSQPFARVYRNDGYDTFTNIQAPFTGMGYSSVSWGDYNADGLLDLLMSGSNGSYTNPQPFTKIYRNTGTGTFEEFDSGLPGVYYGDASWADIDNDGDLDVAMVGATTSYTSGYAPIARVFRNTGSALNTAPTAPVPTSSCVTSEGVTFGWDAATDAQTPASGLSYNIRVGTTSGANDIFSGMARADGKRLVMATGNAQTRLEWSLKNGSRVSAVYWSVQAVDSSFAGSAWSAEQSIRLFRISGCVRSHGGTPIAGVTVTASGGVGEAITDASGNYEIVVPEGWDGTVSAAKGTWAFTPASVAYSSVQSDQTNQNYTADRCLISGQVKEIGGAAYYRVVLAASNTEETATTDSQGYYKLFVPVGWSGSVRVIGRYTLDPASREYADIQADFAAQDFTERLPLFTNLAASFQKLAYGSAALGDYDKDGDLDLAVCGQLSETEFVTRIYRNNLGSGFTELNPGMVGVSNASLAWADIDNDGDLDLAIAGSTVSQGKVTKIYRYDGGATFTDIGAPLVGAEHASLCWADYDNDGDPDLAVAGWLAGAKLYKNSGGAFVDSGVDLGGLLDSRLSWADYDNDGDFDLAVAGYSSSVPGYVFRMLKNDSGSFTATDVNVGGVSSGNMAWGDYDNDGDLDLVVIGIAGAYPSTYYSTKVYRNDGGSFVDINAHLTGVNNGTAAWGDYDNDGDLDLFIAGYTGNDWFGMTYRNDGGTFVENYEGVTDKFYDCSAAWGDFDKDGNLDLFLSGSYTGKLYRNGNAVHNTAPTAPQPISATMVDSRLEFKWNAGADAQTPASGLSYNLRVGTAPGKDDVFSGMAATTSGYRRVPALGNAQKRLSWSVDPAVKGTNYYWAVQSIDSAYAGSGWSAESSLSFCKISGHIRRAGGAGVSGVTVSASSGGPSVVSDNSGYYELYVVSGWSGSIAVQKQYFTFVPSIILLGSVIADRVDQDFAANPPVFEEVPETGLVPATNAHVAWGDIDNDGDMDAAISGGIFNGQWWPTKTNIYKNNGGSFAVVSQLEGADGELAWVDFDNDGDLDLSMVPGWLGAFDQNRVYTNDGAGNLTNANLSIGERGDCIAWGDYNNDGWLDMSVAGYTSSGVTYSRLYRNASGAFTDAGASLSAASNGSTAWGDFDNDGDLDLALCGYGAACWYANIYRNDNGTLTDINAGLTGVEDSSAAWGDYDGDGDLDIVITGSARNYQTAQGMPLTRIYTNKGNGTFSVLNAGLVDVRYGNAAWGDYDNDGDLDLALCGTDAGSVAVTKVYRNDGNGAFVDSRYPLAAVAKGTVAWTDYDNDGDLDLSVVGDLDATMPGTTVAAIYRNTSQTLNTPPVAPAGLYTTFSDGNEITFSWDAASDAQTPSKNLSYNLRVGTAPGKDDVLGAMANSSTGKRLIQTTGNSQLRQFATLKGLSRSNTYYWAVQAVDTAFVGSAWSQTRATQYVSSGTSIISAKSAVDGSPVSVDGPSSVTAVFGNRFYIEDATRVSAIRVDISGCTPRVGQAVRVSGVIKTDLVTGERYIQAGTVCVTGNRTIAPLGMANKSVSGSGLQIPGLLVKVWGRFTKTGDSSFALDDGSGCPVSCIVEPGVTLDSSWTTVSVVGVRSVSKVSGSLKTVVLVRNLGMSGHH